MTVLPPRGERYFIEGSTVLSPDPLVRSLPRGDVLIEGTRIVGVGADRDPRRGSDPGRMCIVMPGLLDTHHHMYETALRGRLSNALLCNDGSKEAAANCMHRLSVLRPSCISQRTCI